MSSYFHLYLMFLTLLSCLIFVISFYNFKTNRIIRSNCLSSTFYDDELIKCCQKIYENKNVLIVGDGDFSFSKVLSQLVDKSYLKNTSLIATTLDNKESLTLKFPMASENIEAIVKNPNCKVEYLINATNLPMHYKNSFDIVVFNFPHWNGKQNNKHNRHLLFNFLNHTKMALRDDNCSILVTLNENQSGAYVDNFLQWKETWQLTHYAAQAGLLLTSIDNFLNESFARAGYTPTGRRGISSKFPVRAHMYRLQQPVNGMKAVQGTRIHFSLF